MRSIALGALAIASAAAALLAVLLWDGPAAEVSPNRLVTDGGVIDAQNSPSLVRDPRMPERVVATYRVDRPGFSAGLRWSTDGGKRWKSTDLPLPRGLDRPYAPDAAFGPDGTLYVTYVNLQGTGNVPGNLWVSKSSDGGRTLSAPVRIVGRLAFQARTVVDAEGVVHVSWLQGSEVGLLALTGAPSPVVAARSGDGGRSFSRPVPVSDARRTRVGAASPVIDSDGQLVILYEDFKEDRRDFENLEGPPWDQPFGLVVTRPVGEGQFSKGIELEKDVVPTRRFLPFVPEFPSLAAGPGDTLYVTWSDGRNGDEDVFLRRSDDDGRTWSAAKRVNDNPPADGTSQYLPRIDVAPDGRVDVLYLDRRRDQADVMTDATLASSHDDGASFRSARISRRSFDSRVGPQAAARLPVDFGSRLGLDSAEHRSLAAWTDTRLGSVDTGRQDVFSAVFEAPGPSGGPARAVMIGGLAVLALVFAAAAAGSARASRSRRS